MKDGELPNNLQELKKLDFYIAIPCTYTEISTESTERILKERFSISHMMENRSIQNKKIEFLNFCSVDETKEKEEV